MSQEVRWGVLGCANFARKTAIPAMLKSRNVRLAAVASRTKERAEEFARESGAERAYGSYEDLLADDTIQAVYNPLPNGMHGEWVIEAARAGKHSLCEKPFTSTADEARAVAEAANAAGVQVMEAFMWRFHPQHALARKAIDDGEIGHVRIVRAAFSFPIVRQSNIRLSADLDGGSVMDVGCYTISGSRFYFGGEPLTAYARGAFDPEYGVDMSMAGVLDFGEGRAVIDCGFNVAYRCEIEVVGEKGRIHIPKSFLPDEEATLRINDTEHRLPPVNQYVLEFEHFSECVLDWRKTQYGLEDAIAQMKVVDAVRRSMRSGAAERIR
jgi:predicted dehydrogenase